MSDTGGRRFEFVNISNPDHAVSREVKRKVRSVAAKKSTSRALARTTQDGIKGNEGSTHVLRFAEVGSAPVDSDLDVTWDAWPVPNPMELLGAARRDPFNSSSRGTTPFESYLLDHFLTYMVPFSVPCVPIVATKPFRQHLGQLWGGMAIQDAGMMSSLLLAASRNLGGRHHPEIYNAVAERYRAECLRNMRAELSEGRRDITHVTVTKALALAADARASGRIEETKKHMNAAVEMVAVLGGVHCLEVTGAFGKFLLWFLKDPEPGRSTVRADTFLQLAQKGFAEPISPMLAKYTAT